MSKKGAAEKLLLPLVAAGTSVAASYLVKKAPGFFEETVLPRLREAAQSAEALPERARSVAGGTGELAEQLTHRARGAAGGNGGDDGRARASRDELAERREERARHRARRRKAERRG